jgi:hypothetical protein
MEALDPKTTSCYPLTETSVTKVTSDTGTVNTSVDISIVQVP